MSNSSTILGFMSLAREMSNVSALMSVLSSGIDPAPQLGDLQLLDILQLHNNQLDGESLIDMIDMLITYISTR